KLKNPYKDKDLKRYVWAIARLGGWKGYTSERKPGITTLWIGIQKFNSIMQGWKLFEDVS
ncbi:IS4 family transposase, partial [Flavobacterium salmonis]